MSQFKDLSLQELYNTPSTHAPGQINWKSVAVYGGIAVVVVIVGAIIVNQGYKITTKLYLTSLKDMQKKHSEDIAKKDKQIEILFSRISVPQLEQQTEASNES